MFSKHWLIAFVATATLVPGRSPAQSTLPLLQERGLRLIGSFRLPQAATAFDGVQTLPLAYNQANNSLFLCGTGGPRSGQGVCAEMTIPTPVDSGDRNDLPFARLLQPAIDPTEGQILAASPDGGWGNGIFLGGLLVENGVLHGTAFMYYDASAAQQKAHFKRSMNLRTRSFNGWYALDAPQEGFISGYLADVPPALQPTLGGKSVAGQCCIPIVSRTSYGPSLFSYDPANLAVTTKTVPTTPLVYYTGDHTTLGMWEGANPIYGGATQIGGLAIPAGYRSILFFGKNGTGNSFSPSMCYGPGTPDPSQAGKPNGEGDHYCYDPSSGDKGQHAWPYYYYVLAYDANELGQVRSGARRPWDARPYASWKILADWTAPNWTPYIGGVAYDPWHQLIYVSQLDMDSGEADTTRPLMHVFKVGA